MTRSVRVGFPPRPLPADTAADATIESLGIKNGETVIVSKVVAAATPQPPAPAPTPAPKANPAPAPTQSKPAPSKPTSEMVFERVDGGFLVLRVSWIDLDARGNVRSTSPFPFR